MLISYTKYIEGLYSSRLPRVKGGADVAFWKCPGFQPLFSDQDVYEEEVKERSIHRYGGGGFRQGVPSGFSMFTS